MAVSKNGSMESVTLGRVPDEERKSWLNVAGIQAGIMISIPCIMIGGTLATCMPFGEAVAATAIGYLASVIVMTLIGMQSSDTGRPMGVVATSAFGDKGVRVFLTTLFSCALIAWFGYQTIVCGESFSALMSQFFGLDVDVSLSSVIWGIVMLATAVWGINALGWLNKIAVPALVIVTVAGAFIAINTYGLDALSSYQPAEEARISLFAGIALVFSGQSCGTVVTGDITRFQKSRKDTFLSTVVGVFPVSLIMIIMGYIMAVLVGDSDITNILCILGMPVLGLLVLILATWTTNTTNSYSAGIDMVMLFGLKDDKRALMTIVAGVLGTVLALTGIMNYFMTFLSICGYAFGPVAGVIVADYWIVRKGKVENWFYKSGFDIVGIASWLVGVVFTVVVGTELAVFEGMAISFVLYIVLRKLIPEKKNVVAEPTAEPAEE